MKNCLLFIFLLSVLFSCKKENENPVENLIVEDFLPFEIGNNWTYDRYTVQPDGTEELQGTEIVTVSNAYNNGDTTFVEVSYSSVGNNLSEFLIPEKFYFLNGKMVSQDSDNSFLSAKQSDTLSQIVYSNVVEQLIYINTDDVPQISVPAGDFQGNLIQKVIESRSFDPDYPHGNPRFAYSYYEKEIGCVWAEVFYNSSPETIRWKLRAYDLN